MTGVEIIMYGGNRRIIGVMVRKSGATAGHIKIGRHQGQTHGHQKKDRFFRGTLHDLHNIEVIGPGYP